MAAQLKIRIDTRVDGPRMQLFKPSDLCLRERFVHDLRERSSAPQRERVTENDCGLDRVAARKLLTTMRDKRFEAIDVTLPVVDT